jgi:Hydrogenase maturation factor
MVTTFGDMLKVPGTESSLGAMKAQGYDVRVVYSVLDALEMAVNNPRKKVVHIAIGFETTAPTIAAALERAKMENLKNFYVFSAHKLFPRR